MAYVLLCCICGESFSEHDVLVFRYFPSNGVCYKCCRAMVKQPHSVSCFGKRTVGTSLGYEGHVLECTTLCPDRQVCKMFATGKVYQFRELTAEARKSAVRFLTKSPPRKRPPTPEVFKPGSIVADAFKMASAGCTIDDIVKLCASRNTDRGRVLRTLRREEANGHKWEWQETRSGGVRILYPRPGT